HTHTHTHTHTLSLSLSLSLSLCVRVCICVCVCVCVCVCLCVCVLDGMSVVMKADMIITANEWESFGGETDGGECHRGPLPCPRPSASVPASTCTKGPLTRPL